MLTNTIVKELERAGIKCKAVYSSDYQVEDDMIEILYHTGKVSALHIQVGDGYYGLVEKVDNRRFKFYDDMSMHELVKTVRKRL